jgi:hypothetical protein
METDMLPRLLLSAAVPILLGGCGPGLPFSQHPDPNAAQAVVQAGPEVQDCQARFKAWLGATPVKWDTGPTITRTEETVSIRLEAQPTAPTVIDPVDYHCDYDGKSGELSSAGPVS